MIAPKSKRFLESYKGDPDMKLYLVRISLSIFCASFAATTSSLAQSGSWSIKASMPTARSAFAIGEVNGVLYAVGGSRDRPNIQPLPDPAIAVVEAYDSATDTWTTKAPMPTPRMNLGVGVINGILYAVGGQSQSGIYNTLEAYDP